MKIQAPIMMSQNGVFDSAAMSFMTLEYAHSHAAVPIQIADRAAPHANCASKLVIWCLPAACAITAGPSGHALSHVPVVDGLWFERWRPHPGSGRRTNASKARHDSRTP